MTKYFAHCFLKYRYYYNGYQKIQKSETLGSYVVVHFLLSYMTCHRLEAHDSYLGCWRLS